jgi:hypothetical protein
MKRILVVACFAAVMLMAFSSSAFALHGAYNSTGASCAECHSVHDATGGASQNLFIQAVGPYQQNTGTGGTGIAPASGFTNSNTEHLCEYCHVYGGHVIAQVYGAGLQGGATTMAAHKIGATDIPNSSAAAGFLKGNGTDGGLGCVDCHNALPHAAKSGKTWASNNSTVRMADPAGATQNMYTQDLNVAAYGNQPVNAFCARCHDKNMELNLGGTTHVLTSNTTMNTTNYGSNVQVAWGTSETCVKCHNVKEFHSIQAIPTAAMDSVGATYTGTAIAGTKPFQTSTEATGSAFTAFGPGIDRNNKVTAEIADGICLSCHMDPTAGVNPNAGGVGVSF